MTTLIAAALRAVSGDVTAVVDVERAAHQQLVDAVRQADGPLVLSRDAVASVVRRYADGQISEAEAQRWAALMRRGYVSDSSSTLTAQIEIEYDLQHESAIVEALARLDELGDIIDGELRPGEAAELLRALEDVE
jgi:hypothetical protein